MQSQQKTQQHQQGFIEQSDDFHDQLRKNTHYHHHHHQHKILSQLKYKEQQLKRYHKQRYGEHYNYNYRKPIQNKMYRIQQNRNTQIEKANRLLLQKIQNIFKRSGNHKSPQYTTQNTTPINHPSRNQSHYLTHLKSNDKIQDKDKSINHINYHTNHNYFVRNNQSDMTGSMGAINKRKQLGKHDAPHQQTQQQTQKINEGELNRNLVKLTSIKSNYIQRQRQKRQQSISCNTCNINHHSTNSSLTKKNLTDLKSEPNTQKQPDIHDNPHYNTIPENPSHQLLNTEEHSPPKWYNSNPTHNSFTQIVLHKQDNVKIQNTVFNIEVYVQHQIYMLVAWSQLSTGKQLKQIISMPYKDYHQMYKQLLQYKHQKIIQYLKIQPVNKFLQLYPIQNKYIDIIEYAKIQVPHKPFSKPQINNQKQNCEHNHAHDDQQLKPNKQNSNAGIRSLNMINRKLFNIQIAPPLPNKYINQQALQTIQQLNEIKNSPGSNYHLSNKSIANPQQNLQFHPNNQIESRIKPHQQIKVSQNQQRQQNKKNINANTKSPEVPLQSKCQNEQKNSIIKIQL